VVEDALAGLTADGTLSVAVREVPAEATPPSRRSYLLSVHGGDRPGIVSSVAAEVARVGGNITDLTTRLAGELYVLTAEVELPEEVDVTRLVESLGDTATRLGVKATLSPLVSDDL
jgi:glycine cleavage system transcriptional repressor